MKRWIKKANTSHLSELSILAFVCVGVSFCLMIATQPSTLHAPDPLRMTAANALIFAVNGAGFVAATMAIRKIFYSGGRIHGELLAALAALLSIGGMLLAGMTLWEKW